MPKNHIMTVRQTSARERDTGDIFFETVTAIGTEMAIEMIRPAFNRRRNVFDLTSSQYPLIFSR
jgi:1,2-phenylacetyl-CoA epoxidase PaaB subunit